MHLSNVQYNLQDILYILRCGYQRRIMNGLHELKIVQWLLILSQRDQQLLIIRSRDVSERDISENTTPPINVNDLFLQHASRCITISSVIAPRVLRLCSGLLFLFLLNETNFQRVQNGAWRIQRHRFIINFTFPVGYIRPFSASSDVNKCFPR